MTAANGATPGAHAEPSKLAERLAVLERENTELRRHISLSHSLLAHGPMVLFRCADAPGLPIEEVSPNVSDLLGFSDTDFTNRRITYGSLIHPDDRERVAAEAAHQTAAGVPTFEQEYRVLHASGETRWIYHFTIVARNEHGAVAHYIGYVLDITERKLAEEALALQVELLNNLINTLPFPVFYKDTEGIYLGCNRAFAEGYIGRPLDEVIGQAHNDLAAAQAEAIGHALLERGGTQSFEAEIPYADGERHATIFHLSAFARPDGCMGGVLGAMLDITAYRQAEAEKSTLQQRIIDSQQASIRELSAPLLPLANHVVALPLVGAIDSGRAQHITATLLEGITEHQADVAIVDITGVQVVDTQVANAIIRAARAANLLGAQVVLTGIKPEVAQTLVQLGIELNGIITRSTFQSAIDYALLRS